MPQHNEALAGDVLTTIQLNFEWRKIVAAALSFYWTEFFSSLGLDNEDLRDKLLIDLYNAENIMNKKVTIYPTPLSSNRLVSSLTYVNTTDLTKLHTFTYPKALITCRNISMVQNTVNEGICRVAVDGETPIQEVVSDMASSTVREMSCMSYYENLVIGVETTVRLQAKVITSGQLTINANVVPIWEIIEWE